MECQQAAAQLRAACAEVERLNRVIAMYEKPRTVEPDWTNCRHNERVDPDTGECLDCGTVLP